VWWEELRFLRLNFAQKLLQWLRVCDLFVHGVREIEHETRADRLREMALILYKENVRLRQLLHERHGTDPGNLELELRYLHEQLAARNRALFGPSSEKRLRETEPQAQRLPQSGHGPREQPELPVVEEIHELDAPDQVCPTCGDALEELAGQYEESEEVDVVARSYRLVRHRRKKYRCRRGHGIETALGPPKLIAGGRYSVEFAADVAVSKYADHLPLARQVKQMRRAGLEIDSQTLWDQLVALEMHLEPSYEALVDDVRAAYVVGADETTWPVMGKGKTKRWWAWTLSTDDAVAYRILPSRSAEAARELLGEFEGTVVCDGYSAYAALEKGQANARDGPRFELAHCWAHVRRKFVEAEPHYPEARTALELIGELYAVEREIREADVPDRLAHTARLRAERSAPVLEALYTWMREQRALPRSALGKAIAYTAGLWTGLTRFLDEPQIPLDNNGAERGLRGLVVGRKNHYGSRSLHGTRVAALFYTLIESAKLVGVDPAQYLAQATRHAIASPGVVTLPRDLLE
jgi:transposase